ncbi:hypothetical protein [Halosolutus halophilus]|uniref:hypothetical protein n=1 Tax=Halosolutus halophilus TaxID=1552990 RepID=UPI00223522ED|nr:hypothetical protein [Halosolutus halophilus]
MSENDTTDKMRSVSHTNPYTGETAGRLFSRGPTVVAADGGKPAATDPNGHTDDEPGEADTMEDVSHTPPKDADDANRVFERGKELVEDEE